MKCPNCRLEIKEENLKKEYTKLGRKAVCYKCGKGILFTRTSKDFMRRPDGSIRSRKRLGGRK